MAQAFVKAASDLARFPEPGHRRDPGRPPGGGWRHGGSVARINDLLTKFEKANQQVVSGTALGADVSDAMDTRDGLIAQLSEEIGITVVPRAGNDIALYTEAACRCSTGPRAR